MAEQKVSTKNYPVSHSNHSLILEVTPLYTTILTEELNRLYASEQTLRQEVKTLRTAIGKMTQRCKKP